MGVKTSFSEVVEQGKGVLQQEYSQEVSIIMHWFVYIDKREVLQQEYSQEVSIIMH